MTEINNQNQDNQQGQTGTREYCFIAVEPCGCVTGAAIDEPGAEEWVASFIRSGRRVERVPAGPVGVVACRCRPSRAATGQKQTRDWTRGLSALVLHMWVHDGYPQNGYLEMTTTQKHLFCSIIGARYSPLKPIFDGDCLSSPAPSILHHADAGTFPRLGVRKDGGAE